MVDRVSFTNSLLLESYERYITGYGTYTGERIGPGISGLLDEMGAHPLVKEGISLIADFVPGVSHAKSASDLNVGRDIITGEELDELDYASSAVGIAVPSARGITNGVKFGW